MCKGTYKECVRSRMCCIFNPACLQCKTAAMVIRLQITSLSFSAVQTDAAWLPSPPSEYVKHLAAVLKSLKFFDAPIWRSKGQESRKVGPGKMRFNVPPVPLRLWPHLRLSHSHICPIFLFLSWNHSSCSSPVGPHCSQHSSSSSSSSCSFLYICIVVCSHNDRIHGNTDPVVLNNEGVWMRGRAPWLFYTSGWGATLDGLHH